MFNFVIEDLPQRNRARTQNYRMSGLKHNPYVGTFGGNNKHENNDHVVMTDTRTNPVIGVFRHSPASSSLAHIVSLPIGLATDRLRPGLPKGKGTGLKGILYSSTKPPLFSQLQVTRASTQTQTLRYNLLTSLRHNPLKKFSSTPSVGSNTNDTETRSVNSELLESTLAVGEQSTFSVGENSPIRHNDDVPMCAICLVAFEDGDEIRSLACSHCFHNECVNHWVFHRCLSNDDISSLNCPECRQDHVALSECSSSTNLNESVIAEGISSASLLRVGENMALEGGYDFLSDIGSDLQSPSVVSQATLGRRSCTPGALRGTPGRRSRADSESCNLSIPRSRSISSDLDTNPIDSCQVAITERPPLCASEYSDCGLPLHSIQHR